MTNLKKIAIGVASAALVAGMGIAPANAAELVLPGAGTVDLAKQRLAGSDRVETSLKVAKHAFEGKTPKTVYFVGYNALVDAATSGMLTDGPIVAMPKGKASQKLMGYTLKKEFPTAVEFTAIGGTGVISEEDLKTVMETAGVKKSSRLAGADRYETNVAVAKAAFPNPTGPLYLTRGDMVVDALTAGTLKSGPVLLVNPMGDVNKATAEYVKANSAFTAKTTVVIGGTGAVSDAQALKLFPADEAKGVDVTPWNSEELKKAQMTAVQKAAAKYYGQGKWQHMEKDKLESSTGTSMTADDVKKGYDEIDPTNWVVFGLGGADVTGTNADPSSVDITSAVTGAADAFVGYAPAMTGLETAKGHFMDAAKLETQLNDIQTKLTAVKTSSNKTADKVVAKAGGSESEALYKALAVVYGKAAIDGAWPTTDGRKIKSAGLFTFDGKDSDADTARNLTGINKSVVDAFTAEAKTADTKLQSQISGSAAFDKSLSVLAKEDATALLAALSLTDTTNLDVNKVALKELFMARYDAFAPEFKAAKKDLIDQVRGYLKIGTNPGAVDSSTSTMGMKRLAGKDRYETSAYVSVYRQSAEGDNQIAKLENTMQYLASGEDAHLVDAVFSGQLTDGSVLLVPSKGDINGLVMTDLKYSYKYKESNKIKPSKVYAIGGTGAVSDDVFKAALTDMVK